MSKPKLHYWFEMPNKFTFKMARLRRFIVKRCKGRVLFPFAGQTRIPVLDALYVDSNPEMKPDIVGDAQFIDELVDEEFDSIVSDPPYSLYQAIHTYDGHRCRSMTKVRDALNNILKSNGIYIELGYTATGMSVKRGFVKKELAVVNLGNNHNAILITVEKRRSARIGTKVEKADKCW